MTARDRYPLADHAVPGPPATLRDRTLRAATQALDRDAPTDLWTRLWENRTARIAWAACIVALVAAHVAVTPRSAVAPRIVQMEDEISELTRLPRLDAEAVARVSRIGQENPR